MISPFLKKLLFARQFSIINGKIEVLGKKQSMLPSSLVLELQNTNLKSYEIGKKVSLEVMRDFGKKLGTAQGGMLRNIKDIYETFGLGSFEVSNLDNKNKKVVVRIRESPTALAHLDKNKKSANPICLLTSGLLAGMFSYLFSNQIESKEVKCLAKGDEFCEFLMSKE